MPKKDLGLIAMSYGNVYVASIAFGAKDAQTVKAFLEAEAYPGPSLIIAYSHCIAHGYDMAFGCEQQKLAVDSGMWPIYRFDPRRIEAGQPPLQLDCGAPKIRVEQYMKNENRFRILERLGTDRARALAATAQRDAERRFQHYQQLSGLSTGKPAAGGRAGEGLTMDLSTKYLGFELPHPLHARRLAPGGRHGHGAPARGLRRGGDRHALALRRADRRRAPGSESPREPRGVLRRGGLLRARRRDLRAGPG